MRVGDVEGAAFGGTVADPSRSHHDVATEFSDLQFIFREGCREKGRVTRAGSGKDGEISSARGIPSSFLRDETREGRGDGARGLEPTDGKSGRSEGDKRRESGKKRGDTRRIRAWRGDGGNRNSRGRQWLRTQVASGMGEEPRTRGIWGMLSSGGSRGWRSAGKGYVSGITKNQNSVRGGLDAEIRGRASEFG